MHNRSMLDSAPLDALLLLVLALAILAAGLALLAYVIFFDGQRARGQRRPVHRADGHRENRPMEQVLEWIFTVAVKPFSRFANEYLVPVSRGGKTRTTTLCREEDDSVIEQDRALHRWR
jgi:hypothetical protein